MLWFLIICYTRTQIVCALKVLILLIFLEMVNVLFSYILYYFYVLLHCPILYMFLQLCHNIMNTFVIDELDRAHVSGYYRWTNKEF